MKSGSSPLTRGKLTNRIPHGLDDGLIPAHAGKTSRGSSRPVCPRAHPRSRGENAGVFLGIAWSVGSSPLTRGKLAGQALAVSALGLIPAHAGKTGFKAGDDLASGAHPRSRGENAPALVAARIARGSSPLTRGKRDVQPPRSVHEGLIPAHAGKTARDACAPR